MQINALEWLRNNRIIRYSDVRSGNEWLFLLYLNICILVLFISNFVDCALRIYIVFCFASHRSFLISWTRFNLLVETIFENFFFIWTSKNRNNIIYWLYWLCMINVYMLWIKQENCWLIYFTIYFARDYHWNKLSYLSIQMA